MEPQTADDFRVSLVLFGLGVPMSMWFALIGVVPVALLALAIAVAGLKDLFPPSASKFVVPASFSFLWGSFSLWVYLSLWPWATTGPFLPFGLSTYFVSSILIATVLETFSSLKLIEFRSRSA